VCGTVKRILSLELFWYTYSMTKIYLTKAELVIWNGLEQALKDGWNVEDEKGTSEDSPTHRTMRLQLVRLQDPRLLAFVERAKKCASSDELAALITSTDLQGVVDSDLAELFFAIGPVPITAVMQQLLKEAKTDNDIDGIAALSTIRNSLYLSIQPK
jgi:hypothetical protein